MDAALPLEFVEYDESVEETGDVSEMSAEQYLSWVRTQASTLPAVVRADVDTSKFKGRQSVCMPQLDEILQCPPEFLPNDNWVTDTMYSFSQLRMSLERSSWKVESRERKLAVPVMKDVDAWRRFCLGAYTSDVATSLPLPTAVIAATTTAAAGGADATGIKAGLDATSSGANCSGSGASSSSNDSNSFSNSLKHEQASVNKRKRDLVAALGLTAAVAVHDDDDDDGEIEKDMNRIPGQGNAGALEEGEEEEEEVGIDFDQEVYMEMWSGPKNVSPDSEVLLQFDQVLTQKLLGYQVDWLENSLVTPQHAKWVYGLLARLEKPLHRDSVAVIRQLYRRCCYLRKMLSIDNADFDTALASLNVLIVITGAYFGQGEEYVELSTVLGSATTDQEIIQRLNSHHAAGGEGGAGCAGGALSFNMSDFAAGGCSDEDDDEEEEEDYYDDGGGGDDKEIDVKNDGSIIVHHQGEDVEGKAQKQQKQEVEDGTESLAIL